MTEGRNQGRKIKRGAESQKDRRVARKAGVGRKEKENQRGRETGRKQTRERQRRVEIKRSV